MVDSVAVLSRDALGVRALPTLVGSFVFRNWGISGKRYKGFCIGSHLWNEVVNCYCYCCEPFADLLDLRCLLLEVNVACVVGGDLLL